MLINIKKHGVASLPFLLRLVLKYIYEPNGLSIVDENLMYHSINSWASHAMPSENEVYYIQRLGWMLKEHQKGGFNDRIKLFQEHKINYKMFHKLPEAHLGVTNERRREIQKIKETERLRQLNA